MKAPSRARRGRRALAVGVIACAAAASCSSSRRSEPLVGARPRPGVAVAAGERVYMEHCNPCHPQGEGGLGPSLNDKPLPPFLISFQVRRGLGAMPAFDEHEISEADVEDLIAYLVALRAVPDRAR